MGRLRITGLIVLLSIGIVFGLLVLKEVSEEPIRVSLVQLIAHPAETHRRRVLTEGVFLFDMGTCGITLTEEQHRFFDPASTVLVELGAASIGVTLDELERLDGKHVMVEGIYSIRGRHDSVSYAGTLKDVTRLELDLAYYDEETSNST